MEPIVDELVPVKGLGVVAGLGKIIDLGVVKDHGEVKGLDEALGQSKAKANFKALAKGAGQHPPQAEPWRVPPSLTFQSSRHQ